MKISYLFLTVATALFLFSCGGGKDNNEKSGKIENNEEGISLLEIENGDTVEVLHKLTPEEAKAFMYQEGDELVTSLTYKNFPQDIKETIKNDMEIIFDIGNMKNRPVFDENKIEEFDDKEFYMYVTESEKCLIVYWLDKNDIRTSTACFIDKDVADKWIDEIKNDPNSEAYSLVSSMNNQRSLEYMLYGNVILVHSKNNQYVRACNMVSKSGIISRQNFF